MLTQKHIVTTEITKQLGELLAIGLLHLFVQHTFCAFTINENTDPSVCVDINHIMDKLVPENALYYTHTLEGSNDCLYALGTPSLVFPLQYLYSLNSA